MGPSSNSGPDILTPGTSYTCTLGLVPVFISCDFFLGEPALSTLTMGGSIFIIGAEVWPILGEESTLMVGIVDGPELTLILGTDDLDRTRSLSLASSLLSSSSFGMSAILSLP